MKFPFFDEPAVIRFDGARASTGRRTLSTRLSRPARPFAVLTWGCRPESTIHAIAVDEKNELVSSIAGTVFGSLLAEDEFERLLDRRPDGHDAVRALWRLFSYHPLAMSPVGVEQRLTVDIEGPFDHLVLLAKMPDWQSWEKREKTA